MKKLLFAALLFLTAPLFAARVFEQSTVANLPTCGSPTIGNVYYVTDGSNATDCSSGGGSSKHACVCNGTSWVIVGDGTGGVGDADYGDIVVTGSGATWTIDTNSVALGSDTTGDYVSAITANQGLLLSGTEAASVGLIDCDENQIVKSTGTGGTSWTCATDETGAPTNSDYLVKTADAGLSAERVVTDTSTVTWDWATAGQAKATAIDLTCTNCVGGTEIDESALAAVPTATALAANPSDCSAGQYATAIAASGNLTCAAVGTAVTDETAPYGQYDPNNPPATCDTCNDWTNDTAENSPSWGNQGSATETLEMDGATLYDPAAASGGFRVRCLAAPASGDFVVHALAEGTPTNPFNLFGVLLLQGTLATPTRIDTCVVESRSTSVVDFTSDRYSNYTTSTSNNWNTSDTIETDLWGKRVYFRVTFIDSSNNMTCQMSHDGRIYGDNTSIQAPFSIAANPAFVCYTVASFNASTDMTAHFEFFRIRTDASKLLAGE